MFKKFAMLLAPFMLAPLGSLLTPSAAHAAEWTRWENCNFTTGLFADYTPWRALIEVRSSDSAARAIRVQYGNGSSERISTLKLQESRIINGQTQLLTPSITFNTGNLTAWTSPTVSTLPFVSATFRPRYINVTLTRADGSPRTCQSRIAF